MVEDLLNATSALTLSSRPKRDGSSRIDEFQTNTRSRHIVPFQISRHQNQTSAKLLYNPGGTSSPSLPLSISISTGDVAAVICPDMPMYPKRPRQQSPNPGDHSITKPPSAYSKKARHASKPMNNAHEPIVISDSDDHVDVDDIVLKHAEDIESSQTSSHAPLRDMAGRYTYNSPTNPRSSRKPVPSTLKPEPCKTKRNPALSSSASSISAFIALTTAITDNMSASTSSPKVSVSAPKKVTNSKTKKASKEASVQLRKTIEAAKAAGLCSIDLSHISAAGFRLVRRCSFCAESFTKSAAAKVKQEHMSLCAPLNGVARNTALDAIKIDIRSAIEREEADEKRVREERTMLQEVVQDADIVRHEGRASQIAASPKKRGRDAVITKKAIKRTNKPSLYASEERDSPRSANPKLLPARKAMVLAREIADQLFGTHLTPAPDVASNKQERDDAEIKSEALAKPSHSSLYANHPTTPKSGKKRFLASLVDGNADDFDGEVDDIKHLPIISAEHIFASIASPGPQKSPVRALQISRQRRASREHEASFGSPESAHRLESPTLPRTQPFAPSKLAKRQRALDHEQRSQLFGAETTTRSLLDLVKMHRNSESSKLEHRDLDNVLGASQTTAGLKRKANDSDAAHLEVKRNKNETACGDHCSSSTLNSDMYIDDQAADSLQLPLAPDLSTPQIGKHQDHHNRLSSAETQTQDVDLTKGFELHQNVVDKQDRSSETRMNGDEILADTDVDSSEDDDDSRSFLDLLEPLELLPEPIMSPNFSPSESSSTDLDEQDAAGAAYRDRRMLVACGGGAISVDHRRSKCRFKGSLCISQHVDKPASPTHIDRNSSVSNSDPDLVMITDDSQDDPRVSPSL
ncbi:uncharacterized protein MEPE_02095 [Melanopsichium pennsylvanicum]|uniref:Uncharacterized protein n=2 Tax=Melanopsichium pennsylvanicum TaxID=63383 RepID=A0AAJ4XJR7_9BASI|nr:hypothetical protein BN887_05344 [Melanopsichium pennsylvanicum 4]SNX83388.1 uncharacterized protein MEPE_02095 [Melanopsichium pennsylvanicum]